MYLTREIDSNKPAWNQSARSNAAETPRKIIVNATAMTATMGGTARKRGEKNTGENSCGTTGKLIRTM
jgi:hypothetical protein